MCDSLSELLARTISARWEQLQEMSVYERRTAIAEICAEVLWGTQVRERASRVMISVCPSRDSGSMTTNAG